MPKFKVKLTRTLVFETSTIVYAKNDLEACDKAEEMICESDFIDSATQDDIEVFDCEEVEEL